MAFRPAAHAAFRPQLESSVSGSSSWVLWHDTGPLSPRRSGRASTVLLALAVLLVAGAVLAVAALAVYMGALRIESANTDFLLEGSMHIISGDTFLAALSNPLSQEFKNKSLKYESMLKEVFNKTRLQSAIRHFTIYKFNVKDSTVHFHILLDRRKLPRSVTDVEEVARNALLADILSAKPVVFRSIHVEPKSVTFKRVLDDHMPSLLFQEDVTEDKKAISFEKGTEESTFEVKNGVLRKAIPKVNEATTTTTTKAESTSKTDSNPSPVIEGTFTITKSEISLSQVGDKSKKSPSANVRKTSEKNKVRNHTKIINSAAITSKATAAILEASTTPINLGVPPGLSTSSETSAYTTIDAKEETQPNYAEMELKERSDDFVLEEDDRIDNIKIKQHEAEILEALSPQSPEVLRKNTYNDRYEHRISSTEPSSTTVVTSTTTERWKPDVFSIPAFPVSEEPWRPVIPNYQMQPPYRPEMFDPVTPLPPIYNGEGIGVAEVVAVPPSAVDVTAEELFDAIGSLLNTDMSSRNYSQKSDVVAQLGKITDTWVEHAFPDDRHNLDSSSDSSSDSLENHDSIKQSDVTDSSHSNLKPTPHLFNSVNATTGKPEVSTHLQSLPIDEEKVEMKEHTTEKPTSSTREVLRRRVNSKEPVKSSRDDEEAEVTTALVTLLPVRSYLGGPLRRRPKPENNSRGDLDASEVKTKADAVDTVPVKRKTTSTTETSDEESIIASHKKVSATGTRPLLVSSTASSASTGRWRVRPTVQTPHSWSTTTSKSAVTPTPIILNTEVVTSTSVEISYGKSENNGPGEVRPSSSSKGRNNDQVFIFDSNMNDNPQTFNRTSLQSDFTTWSTKYDKGNMSVESVVNIPVGSFDIPSDTLSNITTQPQYNFTTDVNSSSFDSEITYVKINSSENKSISSTTHSKADEESMEQTQTPTIAVPSESLASNDESDYLITEPTGFTEILQSGIKLKAPAPTKRQPKTIQQHNVVETRKRLGNIHSGRSTVPEGGDESTSFPSYATQEYLTTSVPTSAEGKKSTARNHSDVAKAQTSMAVNVNYSVSRVHASSLKEHLRVVDAVSKFATVHSALDPTKSANHTVNADKPSNSSKPQIPVFVMLTKTFSRHPPSTPEPHLNLSESGCKGNHSVRCGNGACISPMSRCNQLVDCEDGADERDCSCADYLRAQFLHRKLCDGVVDCWDFSDENNCAWCSPGQFVCPHSQVCIDQERLCDGARDCPYGDDEKQCVTIAASVAEAGDFPYHSNGFLMVRKKGKWGKLCLNNNQNTQSRSAWDVSDLGRAVCKAMTYSDYEEVDRVTDVSSHGRADHGHYYELNYTPSNSTESSGRSSVTFYPTECSERQVVHVTCKNLECGLRPQAVHQWARIVGGGDARPGAWPWQAALYKEGEFQCGATLVSSRWLLSAGHCFYHALDDHWVARLGALRRGSALPSPYEQLRPIARILLHPGYVDAGFVNDLSLLQMSEPVEFSDYVRPACLPPPAPPLKDGRLCTVAGWGQLFEVGRIFPDTLQEVQLPIITTSECRKRTLLLPLYKITDNMFCAGFDRGGRDACLGDSGGPLMCQESNGRWSLYGVTSNGYGCARANRPGVYTKVSNYLNWIQASMTQPLLPARNVHSTCKGHRCPLGECLPKTHVCNGFMECSDGSDEKDCW